MSSLFQARKATRPPTSLSASFEAFRRLEWLGFSTVLPLVQQDFYRRLGQEQQQRPSRTNDLHVSGYNGRPQFESCHPSLERTPSKQSSVLFHNVPSRVVAGRPPKKERLLQAVDQEHDNSAGRGPRNPPA